VDPASAIALSGLTAASLKLAASASNLANADDKAPIGAPAPKRLDVQTTTATGGGVAAAVTVRSASVLAYDPASPLANPQGLLQAAEIDPILEISNQLQAGRAFAFSLKALEAQDEAEKTLLDLKT